MTDRELVAIMAAICDGGDLTNHIRRMHVPELMESVGRESKERARIAVEAAELILAAVEGPR